MVSEVSKYAILQRIPEEFSNAQAAVLGETMWRTRVEQEGYIPAGGLRFKIHEPAFYLDETGVRIALFPLEDEEGNPILDEDGNQIAEPRAVQVVGDVVLP